MNNNHNSTTSLQQADTLQTIGLNHAQAGDMPRAIAYFKQALALMPNDARIHNNLGNAYKKNSQADLAIHHYQTAIRLTPDYANAHNNLAGMYAKQALYQQALQHYAIAVNLEPDFTAAHFNSGLLLLQTQQLQAARIQFNNVLTLNPTHVEARFYLGVLDLNAEQLDAAKYAFEQILQYDINHVEALSNLGVIALKQEQPQLAIDYFSKALAIDNHHIEARNNLAATFIHHDRFENALMHYDVLLQQEPHAIEYLYNSGVAQMALGHLSKAIDHFETLLRHEPKHFAALNNLAAIYIRKDDYLTAKTLLQRALEANPDDKASKHMLTALTQDTLQADTSPEYAAGLFNNYALNYDQHLQTFLHYSIPNAIVDLLDELAISSVASTLDLGCGTGLTGQVLRDSSKRLLGVDIAKKMLAQAQKKEIYDQLIESDIQHFLQHNQDSYELIVAADVLPYLGELKQLFAAISHHLIAGGYFIFTTEISPIMPWQLQTTARFAHHPEYLQQLAIACGLNMRSQQQITARHQNKQALPVLLIALQKPSSISSMLTY